MPRVCGVGTPPTTLAKRPPISRSSSQYWPLRGQVANSLPAGQRRERVRAQAGGVDDAACRDQGVRRPHAEDPPALAAHADHWRRAAHLDPVAARQLGVADGQPDRVDDAVVGKVQRGAGIRGQQRLQPARRLAAHDLGPGARRAGLLQQLRQPLLLRLGERHGQRADPVERRVQRGAQLLPPRARPRHQVALQRAGRAVRPAGGDARVALGGALADVVGRLEQHDRCLGERQLARDRAADHSASNDRHVDAVHGASLPSAWFTIWPVSDTLEIHIVSDSTGDTAARVARAAQSQFEDFETALIRHARVKSREQLEKALEAAAGRRATVFYTLVDPGLRESMSSCRASTAGRAGRARPGAERRDHGVGHAGDPRAGPPCPAGRPVLPPDRRHRVRRQARRRPRRRRPEQRRHHPGRRVPHVQDADLHAPRVHGLHVRQHPDRPRRRPAGRAVRRRAVEDRRTDDRGRAAGRDPPPPGAGDRRRLRRALRRPVGDLRGAGGDREAAQAARLPGDRRLAAGDRGVRFALRRAGRGAPPGAPGGRRTGAPAGSTTSPTAPPTCGRCWAARAPTWPR